MRASPLSLLLVGPALLLGCGEKSDDTGSPSDDTGGDSTPDYEEGCILVDGGGGYANVADALTVASDGSTIELCAGTIEGSLVIDKAVTITGPGPDELVWTASVNAAAVSIEGASGVELSGFSVSSTRNGIDVSSSSAVTLRGLRFDGVAVSGVSSSASTGVVIEGCEFLAPEGGGVFVDGGSVAIDSSTFTAPLAFAVHANDGADVTVSNSVITDVTYTSSGEDGVSDGFALWATEGSTLNTEGNELTNNFVNVLTDSSDVNISGDVITGGLYGLYLAGGVQSVQGVSITDALLVGVRAVTADDVTISDVTISGDPELVDAAEFNWEGYSGGAMLVATDGTFTGSAISIDGYNNNGLMVLGYAETPTTVIDGLTITNSGRRALTQFGGTLDLTNAEIHDTRLVVDRAELDGNYNSQTPGLTVGLWTVNTIWTGGGIYDSEDMGMINYSGSLQVSDFTLDGNYNYGIWNYLGSVYATGSTFTNSSGNAGVANMQGDLTMEGNTFQDNRVTQVYEYVDATTGDVDRTEYLNSSQDVLCYQHTSCTLLNNTFVDGSQGVQVSSGGGALIEGNTFENYHSYAVQASSNTGDTVEVTDNTFTNTGAYPVYCYASDLEVDGVVIDGVVGAESGYASYTNDVENYSYTYTTSGYGIYASSCSLVLNDVEINDAAYHAVYAYDTVAEIYELAVTGGSASGSTSYGTVRISYGSVTPAVLISGLDVVGNEAGSGLQVASSTSLTGGTVIIDGVTVSGSASMGVNLQYLQDAELSNFDISESASHGLSATDSSFTLDVASLTGNIGYGAWIDGGSGAISLTGVTARGNESGGVYLDDATAVISGNSFDGNTGFGMTCEADLTLDTCSSNDLSQNTDGAHDGCDDACEL